MAIDEPSPFRKIDTLWKDRFTFLSDAENEALQELTIDQDMSPNGVLRCALRLYQMEIMRARQGCRKIWYAPDGSEMDGPVGCVCGCGALD